jgi:hypothetical protein
MTSVSDLHNQAMDFAEQALLADSQGDPRAAERLFRQALDSERRAALLVAPDVAAEPTRSVLLRSAASLALDCKEFREAERLISTALAGSPPEEVCDELRELLDQVHFSRHLDLRGLELDPGELQLSLTGNAIGSGYAESRQFLARATDLTRLVSRTAARVNKLEFQEAGAELLKGFEQFFSVPRAACFAISLRIGRPRRQLMLPGFPDPKIVVDELMECLRHFQAAERDALEQRIADESYFNNFIGLAKRFAPDGQRVQSVGLSVLRGRKRKSLTLTVPPKEAWQRATNRSDHEPATVKFTGVLGAADRTGRRKNKPIIKIELDTGGKETIFVQPGLLHDIVGPYWEQRVYVLAERRRSELHLITVEPIGDDASTGQANQSHAVPA